MSTARTTPAQKPRGRTLSKTFPVSVCIIILMNSFRRLYHTSLILMGARCLPAAWFHRKLQHTESLDVAKEVGPQTVPYVPSLISVVYPTKRAVCFSDSWSAT